jgi:glycosyltransferase involved in cell wall biosynthesis
MHPQDESTVTSTSTIASEACVDDGSTGIASSTHLVLIPSYNAGDRLLSTVLEARAHWAPVWVVIDGSTDGSAAAVLARARSDEGIRVLALPTNQGKGAAVLHGLKAARDAGFTHALTMDSDGQHPARRVADFMQASINAPDAMILGKPVFDADAPALRVKGRRVSNWWAQLETMRFDDRRGIGDSLFGFRVYPIAPLIAIMERTRWMRRFDFDPEAVVRLAWRGVKPINVDAEVRYLASSEGGVSHFRYGRDNLLLSGMHLRLMAGFLVRLPLLLARRAKR